MQKISKEIKEQVELSRDYDEARTESHNKRLSKIEKKLAEIAPVNMAKMIDNALSGCMDKMIDQLTDRVVKRLEDAAEEDRRKWDIRRGNQVEATPEDTTSDIKFEPGATFLEDENETVARVVALLAEMEVEQQELEQSKHAPVIPQGEKKGEFPSLQVGQVMILKGKLVVPAVPQQKKTDLVTKPEVKMVPKGPKAGGKRLEVKKPEQGKKPEKKLDEKKKETWMQRVVAPAKPQEPQQQRQQQQHQGENKKGDSVQEVKRSQKKEEMKPVPPGQNLMEKRRVTIKRENSLPIFQKKDLDILSEVNRAHFEAKVPHFMCIQGVTKNTQGACQRIRSLRQLRRC